MHKDYSKKYKTVRIEPKLKKRWESTKGNLGYNEHLTQMLNALIKSPKMTVTLDTDIKIKCPVKISVDETHYCIKRPPKADKLLTLKICEKCQAMQKYESVLELMKDGYTEKVQYPICGGDMRGYKGRTWIKCPTDGMREKLYPTWCLNKNCPKLHSKEIRINLEGLTKKEPNL